MIDDSRKIPTHELIYARLRDMILFGVLAPGQPVTIQGLIAELDAGMTPVREAIRRLTAEGALLPQGNRRVTVPRLTESDLEQVAFARLTIEPRLAELATAAITPEAINALELLDALHQVALPILHLVAFRQAVIVRGFNAHKHRDKPGFAHQLHQLIVIRQVN